MVILPLGNPSCHRGSAWRILTLRNIDLLFVKVMVFVMEVIQAFVTPQNLLLGQAAVFPVTSSQEAPLHTLQIQRMHSSLAARPWPNW